MTHRGISEEERAHLADTRPTFGALGFGALVGTSPSFRTAVTRARGLAAAGDRPILFIGEPGTGKELLARACHSDGWRAAEPFVSLDCRTLDHRLLDSELFGSETGALSEFIGGRDGLLRTAGEGTLFLRRIDELPAPVQLRLVPALTQRVARRVGGAEEFRIRCRIIASASGRLRDSLENGRFRTDLYQRFADQLVHVPPLRERGTDILLLADHFQANAAAVEGTPSRAFSDEARVALQGRSWDGNVRELRHLVREAVLAAEGDTIEVTDLPFGPARPPRGQVSPGAVILIPPAGRTLEDVEAEVIAATLRFANGNKSETARILGISRPTLRRKVRRYGLGEA